MPEGITRLGALHITDAGTTLIPLRSDGGGRPFRDFLHAAYIAKRDKQRRGLCPGAHHRTLHGDRSMSTDWHRHHPRH